MLTDYLEGDDTIPTHVRRSVQTNKGEYWFVDGDTIEPTNKDGDAVRFSDMSVPETLHFLEDWTVKDGDWDGEIIADEIAKLANTQGFNIIPDNYSDEDIYDRLLSPLQNKDGLHLGDKA